MRLKAKVLATFLLLTGWGGFASQVLADGDGAAASLAPPPYTCVAA